MAACRLDVGQEFVGRGDVAQAAVAQMRRARRCAGRGALEVVEGLVMRLEVGRGRKAGVGGGIDGGLPAAGVPGQSRPLAVIRSPMLAWPCGTMVIGLAGSACVGSAALRENAGQYGGPMVFTPKPSGESALGPNCGLPVRALAGDVGLGCRRVGRIRALQLGDLDLGHRVGRIRIDRGCAATRY